MQLSKPKMEAQEESVSEEVYDKGVLSHQLLFNLYTEFMIKELDEEATGIIIGGHNFDSIRYADDAVFVSDEEHSIQEIVQKIADICNVYGMVINVKKTKTIW